MNKNVLYFMICALIFIASFLFFFDFNLKSLLEKDDKKIYNDSTVMHFPSTLIDVGQQKLNSIAKANFIVHNSGNNNLYIQDVMPDCRCTVSSFSKAPILPGDSTHITLTYDSKSIGVFQSSATVIARNARPVLLVFRGVVK